MQFATILMPSTTHVHNSGACANCKFTFYGMRPNVWGVICTVSYGRGNLHYLSYEYFLQHTMTQHIVKRKQHILLHTNNICMQTSTDSLLSATLLTTRY